MAGSEVKKNMQKILEDVLNASIALFRTGEGNVNNAVKQLKKTFDDLKTKGASDQSDVAVKLRSTLSEISSKVDMLSDKAGDAYKDGLKQLETQFSTLVEQINKVVPADKVSQVKSRIDELKKAIKEKLGK